ncbi:hypothetical protein FGO68_gene13984 [Halteria grandinella]|uniref:Uncharacterized protein n=1 Tax=Halteria grandinella TaxID=5974 RepID=A0A8J8SXI0_HALGN|nr:hypothetical protein FGO68_gene13984 [Halteria grandinella]
MVRRGLKRRVGLEVPSFLAGLLVVARSDFLMNAPMPLVNDAAAALDHSGYERAVQPHRRHQIELELAHPFRVAQRREAAGRGRGPAEHVDEDIDVAQPFARRGGQVGAALGRGEIRSDEPGCGQRLGPRSRGREDTRAEVPQERDRRRAGAASPRRHQGGPAFEVEKAAHAPILNAAIFPSAIRKANVSIAGLPGKRPVTRARTTVSPCSSETSSGSAT